MLIDGSTVVPKSGHFLPIWVKVCLNKLAFCSFLSQFYELAFQTKCCLFQTRNPHLSLFLAFVPNFCLKGRFFTKKCLKLSLVLYLMLNYVNL